MWVKNKNSWKEKLADELHTPIKKKFPRRSVIVFNKNEIWSADLVDMQAFSSLIKDLNIFSQLLMYLVSTHGQSQ